MNDHNQFQYICTFLYHLQTLLYSVDKTTSGRSVTYDRNKRVPKTVLTYTITVEIITAINSSLITMSSKRHCLLKTFANSDVDKRLGASSSATGLMEPPNFGRGSANP